MPIYKNLPQTKKRVEALPLYRPIDRLFLLIWEKKRLLLPILIAAVLLALLYGGLRSYGSYVDERVKRDALSDLRSGQKALQEKRYDEAIQLYQTITERRSLPPLFRIAASQNLAGAWLRKGDQERAIAILEKVIQDPENVNPDYSRLLLAKVYEEKGESAQAREIYKALSEGAAAGGSVYGAIQEEAKERIKKWEEKKPKSGKKK